MKKAQLIKKELERIGNRTVLKDGDWISTPFYAYIFHLWRKSKTNFEPDITEIGAYRKNYYFYIGPANHIINDLSENAVLECGGRRYLFKKRDAVCCGDEVIYYTAVLLRIEEDENEI